MSRDNTKMHRSFATRCLAASAMLAIYAFTAATSIVMAPGSAAAFRGASPRGGGPRAGTPRITAGGGYRGTPRVTSGPRVGYRGVPTYTPKVSGPTYRGPGPSYGGPGPYVYGGPGPTYPGPTYRGPGPMIAAGPPPADSPTVSDVVIDSVSNPLTPSAPVGPFPGGPGSVLTLAQVLQAAFGPTVIESVGAGPLIPRVALPPPPLAPSLRGLVTGRFLGAASQLVDPRAATFIDIMFKTQIPDPRLGGESPFDRGVKASWNGIHITDTPGWPK